ncbi:MAG: GGDEF domain-containing protein, partial [Coprobacillus sp.]
HEVPNDKYRVYNSMEECVQAVIDGDVESLTTSSLLLENYPSLKGNKRLFLSPIPNSMSSSQFIIHNNTNSALISIFDKSIQTFTQQQINEIVYRNTVTQSPSISLFNLYELYPTEFAWTVAVLLFIASFVAVLLLLLNRTRLKLARENILQEESYKIVGNLSGEQIFFYDFKTHKLTLPDSFSEALKIDKVQTIKYHKEDFKEPLQKLVNLFYTNKNTSNGKTIEFSCTLHDGSEGWFRAVGTVLPNANGKPLRGIGGLRSIQKEMHQLKQLEKQATTDYLTDLPNRQHCEALILESFNSNRKGTLLIIDIDYFKQINDSMGHNAGDLLLKEFSELLQQQFSNNDILGRWGGDEFIAYIQSVTDIKVIEKKVDTLCKIMNRKFTYKGKKTLLSISVGVAISDGTISYETLFQRADKALYQVKTSSRNNYYIDNDSNIK